MELARSDRESSNRLSSVSWLFISFYTGMIKNIKSLLLVFPFLLLCGCASMQHKTNTLAVVDGMPITEEDLAYSLQIAHRREDLSSAQELDMSQYMQKLIDDALIVQEAGRMGMEQYPEVQKAVDAYILRESVMRLHDEEIVRKVSVTEEEIKNHYKENYERYSLGIIESGSEDEAAGILGLLNKGEDVKELAMKNSLNLTETVLTKKSMGSSIKDALSGLKPGEHSDVVKGNDKYYIFILIGREDAPVEELAKIRGDIERLIRKQKEKEREGEYLALLRERAAVKMNKEYLSEIKLDAGNEERAKWLGDARPLAEVNGVVLTVGDFVAMIPPRVTKTNEEYLDNWINRKIVDREALARQYDSNSDLKNDLYRYKNHLLRNTFIKRVIIPRIEITEKEMEEYYASHRKDFLKPVRYKIQKITLKTLEDAQETLTNLKNGADFAWLIKKRSANSNEEESGNWGWLTKEQMPGPVREIVDTLNPGDVSPILKTDDHYLIIMLQEKSGEEFEGFNLIKPVVYNTVFRERFQEIFSKYTATLKEGAQIKINDDAVRAFEERLKK